MRVSSSLISYYKQKKGEIEGRLDDFRRVLARPEADVFSELAYCICTAQAKAEEADKAVRVLLENGILLGGKARAIRPYLRSVRFLNKKAEYIVAARQRFTERGRIALKRYIAGKDPFVLREDLVKDVLGLGYKEASHFLRNIGLGGDLAILDRYILRCLRNFGVISEIPSSLGRKSYLQIESRMKEFAEKMKIPMDHLDLLLWSSQTGKVFK